MCPLFGSIILNVIDCATGDIRLAGYNLPTQGRVEICIDGVWGTVCNNDWGTADAVVTCRQLGFRSLGTLYICHTVSAASLNTEL